MSRQFPPLNTQKWHLLDHTPKIAADSKGTVHAIVREQAALHERNRLDTVAETLAMVGLLNRSKVLSGLEAVTVTGAQFQWASGSREQGTQAAHCLPGWLHFNSMSLHAMPDWNVGNLQAHGLKAQPLSIIMRNLGGRIDVAASVINVTDSALEKMSDDRGLKSALRRSTIQLSNKLYQRSKDDARVVLEVARDAVEAYRRTASYTCEERLEEFVGKRSLAHTQEASETLEFKSLVAETYLAQLQDRSFEPAAVTSIGFERITEDVISKSG